MTACLPLDVPGPTRTLGFDRPHLDTFTVPTTIRVQSDVVFDQWAVDRLVPAISVVSSAEGSIRFSVKPSFDRLPADELVVEVDSAPEDGLLSIVIRPVPSAFRCVRPLTRSDASCRLDLAPPRLFTLAGLTICRDGRATLTTNKATGTGVGADTSSLTVNTTPCGSGPAPSPAGTTHGFSCVVTDDWSSVRLTATDGLVDAEGHAFQWRGQAVPLDVVLLRAEFEADSPDATGCWHLPG